MAQYVRGSCRSWPPKVDHNPYSDTFLNQIPIGLCLNDMWLGVAPGTDTRKIHVFERDWTTCSEYDNYTRPQ